MKTNQCMTCGHHCHPSNVVSCSEKIVLSTHDWIYVDKNRITESYQIDNDDYVGYLDGQKEIIYCPKDNREEKIYVWTTRNTDKIIGYDTEYNSSLMSGTIETETFNMTSLVPFKVPVYETESICLIKYKTQYAVTEQRRKKDTCKCQECMCSTCYEYRNKQKLEKRDYMYLFFCVV